MIVTVWSIALIGGHEWDPSVAQILIALKRLFQYSLKFINQFWIAVHRPQSDGETFKARPTLLCTLRVMRILLPLQGDRVHETRGIICSKFCSTFANPTHHVVDPVLICLAKSPNTYWATRSLWPDG